MKTEETKLRQELGTMDRILLVLGVFLLVFVAVMVALFAIFQAVPDTLIVSVFGCAGLECGVMGAIKTRKDAIRGRLDELEREREESGPNVDSTCEH